MSPSSSVARLTDIVDAIDLITAELDGISIRAFEMDKRKRWLVERGIEIISEARRHRPDSVKAQYPSIPWRKISGIGNILRHEYERVAHDVLWHVVHNDLPALDQVCREALAAETARDRSADR